jgi:hypothetical protein
VRVVATNTLRVAKNAAELLPELERAIGYPVEIISGEEEGRLIYMGVAGVLADAGEERMVIDIGGGSTEVIRGLGEHIRHVESFGIGTVNQAWPSSPMGRSRQRPSSAPSFPRVRMWKMRCICSASMRPASMSMAPPAPCVPLPTPSAATTWATAASRCPAWPT